MPAGTLRAWFLGILAAIIIPGVNQFFFFRYPNITVGSVRHSLLLLPCPIITHRHCFKARSSTTLIPHRPSNGSSPPPCNNIRLSPQSRPIHNQGACRSHNHGRCRRRNSLCSTSPSFISSHSLPLTPSPPPHTSRPTLWLSNVCTTERFTTLATNSWSSCLLNSSVSQSAVSPSDFSSLPHL